METGQDQPCGNHSSFLSFGPSQVAWWKQRQDIELELIERHLFCKLKCRDTSTPHKLAGRGNATSLGPRTEFCNFMLCIINSTICTSPRKEQGAERGTASPTSQIKAPAWLQSKHCPTHTFKHRNSTRARNFSKKQNTKIGIFMKLNSAFLWHCSVDTALFKHFT